MSYVGRLRTHTLFEKSRVEVPVVVAVLRAVSSLQQSGRLEVYLYKARGE